MAAVSTSELARTAVFAGLDEDSLRTVAEWLEVDAFAPGATLTREGAAGYAFRVLHEGTADVLINGALVRKLGPGEFFGEIGILADGRQTATIVVTSPAIVWTMFGTRFREFQEQHPEISAIIERTAAERLGHPIP